jgi:hypothetical protein
MMEETLSFETPKRTCPTGCDNRGGCLLILSGLHKSQTSSCCEVDTCHVCSRQYVYLGMLLAFSCTRKSGPRYTLGLFRNMIRFYGEELLAPRPTTTLEDNHMSAVRDCLFNIFAATLHIGGRSSIRNLRTRHAAVTGTHGYDVCYSTN